MAADAGTIYLPVAPSFRGFGAAMVKEASGAARSTSEKLNAELGKAGKGAGQAAGKGIADGVKASAQAVDAATGKVVQARKREADAAARVQLAEGKLADARAKGNSDQISAAELKLEGARRRQESAAAQLSSSEKDLDAVRSGSAPRASAVVRSETNLEKARLAAGDASDNVKIAEQNLTTIRGNSDATATQIARAESNVVKARSEQTSAVDVLRSKEELHKATLADVAAQTENAGAKSKTAGERVREFGSGLSGAAEKARGFALGVGGAVTILGKMAFDAASNAQQAVGAVESVFGTNAAEVQGYANQAAQTVGLAQNQYNELASVIGAQLKNLGMPMQEVAGQTNNLVKVGADMAATFGGTTQEAVEALGSALRGERDPIERYGVSITQASIDAWKAANGMDGLTGAADQNANMMATLGLITDQTKDIQGQFGREANTAAGQQQRATAEFENAKIAIGQGLLPVMTTLAERFAGVARWAGEHPGLIGGVAIAMGSLAAAILTVNAVTAASTAIMAAWNITRGIQAAITGAGTAAIAANTVAMGAYNVVTGIGTAITTAFGVALSIATAPITLIIVAIAALVAGLVLFFTKTELGQKIWQGFLEVLKSVWSWLTGVFGNVFSWLAGVATAAWTAIQTGFSAFVLVLQTVWTSIIKPVFDAFMFAVRFLAAILMTVLIAPAIIAWNLLSAAISLAWTTIIKPAWDALAFAAQWLWTSVLMPVFNWIKLGFTLVAQTLFTVWSTIIKVVWDAMAFAANWLWTTVLSPVFNWIKLGFQAVGAFFQFVWNAIIKPAWDAFGAGVRFVWDTIVSPVFGFIKAGLSVVGTFFQNTWNNVIKPAWDALGAGISWVVDNIVRPAFERIKSALDSVKNFFSTVVDGIRTIWDQLKGHVARPINFVIDTVWNNGLVKAWNKIGEFLPGLPGASTLSPIAFAKGGDVPLMPGSKRGKDSVNAMLMPGEHVLTADDVRAMGGQSNVYAWRDALHSNRPASKVGGESLMPRFADGGEVGGGARLAPLPGEGGLQPIAVLARRLIFRIWDSIKTIGGYRPSDPFPEHPSGRALDIMTPNFEVGDQINAWTHANTGVLPIEHTIWKQRWRPSGNPEGSPMEDRGSPTQNHMDHVHTWYKPKDIDPNVIPDGLVGADGLTREDRLGVLKEKIKEIIDKALDPIKDGMASVIGSPPPEWLGIPPKIFDKTKTAAVDSAFDFVENIAGDLKDVYDMAKKVTSSVTNVVKKIIPGFAEGGAVEPGLWRDNGGMIPEGQSVVTNETGKPEAVLNWKQLESIRDILSSLKDIEEFQHLAEVVANMAATGVYDDRAAQYGIDADSDLVESLWFARDAWLESAEAFDAIVKSAGDKAVTGYRDEALDFFGLKGLFDSGMEVYSAFDPNNQSATTATTVGTSTATAVSSDPGRSQVSGEVSTGQNLVYGDPSLGFVNEDVKLETKMPDFDHEEPPGEGAERWRPMMIDALKNQGMDDWASNPDIVDRFIRQIHTESTGNPRAVQGIVDSNGTGESAGVGLGQMIPSTWAAYRDPKLPDDRKNGWAMLNAMARYVRQKYGEQGYMRIGNGVGYDFGGIADGLGFMPKYTLQPERVLSPRQTVAFENWMNAGASMANVDPMNWMAIDELLLSLPSASEFGKIAALSEAVESSNDEEGGTQGNAPLVVIEKLEARDETAAMRAAMREANRVSRSASLSGGWM